MHPSDRPVDRDADPTRVRPDRRDPADLFADPDASPTTVRPRFPSATPVAPPPAGPSEDATGGWATGGTDTDGEDTDRAPRVAELWGEPGRQDARDTSVAMTQAGPLPWGEGDAAAQFDLDGGPTTVLTVAHDSEPRPRRSDWAWVEEWRAERSAPAWAPGIAVGMFVALIVAVALIVLTSGVSDSPVLAVVFNVVIAAGMAPALWLCRSLPVLRFLAAGAAAGIVFGWIAMLTTL